MRVAPTYIDCGKLTAELLRECGSAGDGITVFRGDPSPAELLALLREAPVVLNGHMTIDAAPLSAAPNLRSIVFLGTGASSYVDMTEAARRGIAVRIVRNCSDRRSRSMPSGCSWRRRGISPPWTVTSGPGVGIRARAPSSRTRLSASLGSARSPSRRCVSPSAFGMLVVAWNRSPIVPDLRCETMALYELLTIADAASIRLALTPKTHRFFDAARGRHFKRGVLLVKVANGALY